MTEKRFEVYDDGFSKHIEDTYYTEDKHEHNLYDIWEMCNKLNGLNDENEGLKKGMIGVVDRYIRNVDCNPPSSSRTYIKIKGALMNIREDLRDLIGDFE